MVNSQTWRRVIAVKKPPGWNNGPFFRYFQWEREKDYSGKPGGGQLLTCCLDKVAGRAMPGAVEIRWIRTLPRVVRVSRMFPWFVMP